VIALTVACAALCALLVGFEYRGARWYEEDAEEVASYILRGADFDASARRTSPPVDVDKS